MDPIHTTNGTELHSATHADAETRLAADVRWLRRFAAQVVRDPDLADDACQEAWLGVLRRGATHGERKDLGQRAWRFVFRHWRGERRRRGRELRAAEETGAASATPSAEELLVQHEQQQRLWAELGALDEPYRATLLFRFQAELSTSEVAERMGVPADTVRWRVREGLAQMRRRLTADERRGGWAAFVAATRAWPASDPEPLMAARGPGHVPADVPILSLAYLGTVLMTKKIAACIVLALALVPLALLQQASAPEVPEVLVDVAATGLPRLVLPVTDAPSESGRVAMPSVAANPAAPADLPKTTYSLASKGPTLLLDLQPKDGAQLPRAVTVSVMAYVEGFYPLDRQDFPSVSTGSGRLKLELDPSLETAQLLTAEVTMGSVVVAADGFGTQSSGIIELGWNPGEMTELTMELDPVSSTSVQCVHMASGDPVRNVRVFIVGPSGRVRPHYHSKEHEPLNLQLVDSQDKDDTLYISGDGVALATVTRTELLAIPSVQGIRRLELSGGHRLRGTIELESGLPVAEGTTIHYTSMRRGEDGTPLEYPVTVSSEGQVPIAEDGWFMIDGLPEGLVRLHHRTAGRFRFNTERLSQDFDVEVVGPDPTTCRFVVPERSWTFALGVSWPPTGPFESNTLVKARLYRADSEEDAPYSRPLESRELVATSELIRRGSGGKLILAPGVIESGRPYILGVGATIALQIERRIVFEGAAPTLDLEFSEGHRQELGLSLLPTESDPVGEKASIQEARRRGAALTLEAASLR